MEEKMSDAKRTGLEIAIIGMSGKFPGANNIEQFWNVLKNGVETISFFTDEELLAENIDEDDVKHPNYVKAKGYIEQSEYFDAGFFQIPPIEAELMDPQFRLLHEVAWEAFEDAGYNINQDNHVVGAFIGGAMNVDWMMRVLTSLQSTSLKYRVAVSTFRDYLATRLAYRMNLRGPCFTMLSACSTSLLAVHLGCQSILSGECDMALAGGVAISLPKKHGYYYAEGFIDSKDGHCRTFDHKATGTIFSDGIGLVVLKSLEAAIKEKDHIYAIIKGSAANNDGNQKVGFTAPSTTGQSIVIRKALRFAQVDPESISYVETHGTATLLGDPIEIRALTDAYDTRKKGFCRIGSVKSNLGHLDAAAGVTGLIKTSLALKNRLIPASLHFEKSNPEIDLENSPFLINSELMTWKRNGGPLRAGVSAFGFGGTNTHAILEEAPIRPKSISTKDQCLLVFSARSENARNNMIENLVEYLKKNPEENLSEAAYTLQVGRASFNHRGIAVCRDVDEAIEKLSQPQSGSVLLDYTDTSDRSVVFLFPGQGSQYINMSLGLYESEPVFRENMDKCFQIYQSFSGISLKEVLFPGEADEEDSTNRLKQTNYAQPALFTIEFSLAKLLMSWGIKPKAMLGHSIGEYVAACLAGVFSVEDALQIVAERGKMMQSLSPGSMLAVPLSEANVQEFLSDEINLAAQNGPSMSVLSGPIEAIREVEKELNAKDITCLHLHTSHAFHSFMMEPILEPFINFVKSKQLNPAQLPIASTVKGQWIKPEEMAQPEYWAKNLRNTVRFSDAIENLLAAPENVLLEVGPGQTLSILSKRHPKKNREQRIYSSMRHPQEKQSDWVSLLTAIGQLWMAGVNVDWEKFSQHDTLYRIPLPAYPFDRQKYWIEPDETDLELIFKRKRDQKQNLENWFYIPSWKRSLLTTPSDEILSNETWLIFRDDNTFSTQLVQQVEQAGVHCVVVQIGPNFQKHNEKLFTINPDSNNDYGLLFENLTVIPAKIIHLWNIVNPEEPAAGPDKLQLLQNRGFYSLMFLAQEIGKKNIENEIKIIVVSNNLQEVSGSEILLPERATVFGPVKVIPQEYPNIRCRSVDIQLTDMKGDVEQHRIIAQLLAEFKADDVEAMIALRGKYRLVQTFESTPLKNSVAKIASIRENGVYLITGGLGAIGLEVAKYLAKHAQARLILTGRSAFPDREEWANYLATSSTDDSTALKIRKVQEFEKMGGKVSVYAVDVSDLAQMQEVYNDVISKYGKIDGVVHSAGVPGGGIIQQKDRQTVETIFSPKLNGTLVLDKILSENPLDFFILCSSVAGILGGFGQIDYCAANCFMDTFAQFKNQGQTQYISVNWDAWAEVGMAFYSAENIQTKYGGNSSPITDIEHPLVDKCAFENSQQAIYTTVEPTDITTGLEQGLDKLSAGTTTDSLNEKSELQMNLMKYGIKPDEGIEALVRILNHPTPQVIVSTLDLKNRIEEVNHTPSFLDSGEEDAVNKTRRPRANLNTTYQAPESETDSVLVEMWQNLFGIENVGVNDNFFDLGGDSLYATQIISRVREKFGVTISVAIIFDKPTVAGLTEIINQTLSKKRPIESEARTQNVAERLGSQLPNESEISDVDEIVQSAKQELENSTADLLKNIDNLSDQEVENLLTSLRK